MSDAAVEEVSVLSSIYCGEGEFELLRQSADGVTVQINSSLASGQRLSMRFHLSLSYPRCLPDISISSAALTRSQCQELRDELLRQAAALPPEEAMVHQLIQELQSVEVPESRPGAASKASPVQEQDQWVSVLFLDHIRSRNRYVSLLEHWSKQLQLRVRLILGRNILVLLKGNRANIKEFCSLLKTVKVDVDSSGRKCKERMMKVLIEAPSPETGHRFQDFEVMEVQSLLELRAAFEDARLMDVYESILPSLRD